MYESLPLNHTPRFSNVLNLTLNQIYNTKTKQKIYKTSHDRGDDNISDHLLYLFFQLYMLLSLIKINMIWFTKFKNV